MGDTRLPAISRLISRRSSHSYSIFLALRYHAIQCQAVWRKKTVADCWKCSLNSARDKMLRGNSVRAPTFPRTTVVSRETVAKVESRDSLIGERAVLVRETPIARMKNPTSPESVYFYCTSCCCELHLCRTSSSSRRELQIPSKWRVLVCSISLTNRNVRRKFRAAT